MSASPWRGGALGGALGGAAGGAASPTGPSGPTGSRGARRRSGEGEAVQVVVRCRPMSRKEASQGHTQIINMWPQKGIVHITNPRRLAGPGRSSRAGTARVFTFDSVYDWNAKQDDLYANTVKPLVYSVLDGYNGTIFAYGQTGTGKTYTMLGSQGPVQGEGPREKGIASKCFEDIFRHIAYTRSQTSYVVRASYLEIYQEEARDLLAEPTEPGRRQRGPGRPAVLSLGEDAGRGSRAAYVKGLRSVVCRNMKAIERVMRVGNLNRATAATDMNEHSSRSHAIFQVSIEMQDARGRRAGKLNLVDLAGSERQCKTGAVGDRLKESGKINLSLSALGNVIAALTAGDVRTNNRHIPYRDSKLTQLLQDSLGGNSKAIMIANIGPASYNYDESLMTLRYASRAKHIKNRPTRNMNAAQGPRAALSLFDEEMRALKGLIAGGRQGRQGRGDAGASSSSTDGSSSSSSGSSSGGSTGSALALGLGALGGGDPGLVAPRHRAWPWLGPRLGPRCHPRLVRRPHRAHRRLVWKLHGKFHQETTVKMVRWIQEQMGGRGPLARQPDGAAPKDDGAANSTKRESLVEAELAMQRLVDDLSEDLSKAVLKERMLLSIAQMSEESDRQTHTARAFLKLASELDELRQHTEKEQERERLQALSEEARLRKELALKSAVFRAYLMECNSSADKPSVVAAMEPLADSCPRPVPTLVS